MMQIFNNDRKRLKYLFVCMFTVLSVVLSSCEGADRGERTSGTEDPAGSVALEEIPEYSGDPYIEINQNQPDFSKDELVTDSYESYSRLDEFGRCGEVSACIGKDLMPTEERGKIGQIKPTGWHTVKYEQVEGRYLYNRCHLIGYQLSGENANERNLITGTRYMNTEGMLSFENEVAEYVKDTGNHVMYRITPVFEEDNLVASGVQMEAESVEDAGEGVSYNVYVYNVQPGIEIDYATGESAESEDSEKLSEADTETEGEDYYILNKNTRKFHAPDCTSVEDIKPQNKKEYSGDRDNLTAQGYEPCGRCKP